MKRRGFCNLSKQHGIPSGISLVEVVVAMGIATILMGISMTTMHTVMRVERETSKAAWLGSSFHRFSRLIRSDIHAATGLNFLEGSTDNSPELTIQKPDEEVVKYRIQGHRIFRVVTRKNQQVHQDRFFLPEGSHAYFFQRKRLNQAGISIDHPYPSTHASAKDKLSNKEFDNNTAVKELMIVSSIGHDYRLANIKLKPSKKETN
ncbi:MAG: prepilin-type N-terminal cleavage/methylation domain-containing protein [Gimesia sp.]